MAKRIQLTDKQFYDIQRDIAEKFTIAEFKQDWEHKLRVDSPQCAGPWSSHGYFRPTLSFSRPVSKNGNHALYFKVLCKMYDGKEYTGTELLKATSSQNQTLRYSGLIEQDGFRKPWKISNRGRKYVEAIDKLVAYHFHEDAWFEEEVNI